MNKTFARRLMKAVSIRNMQGNWLKFFIVTILSYGVMLFILHYLPIRIPAVQEMEKVAASGNLNALYALFFPNGITNRMIMLMAIVAALILLVSAPLKVGKCRYFIKVSKGEKPAFSEFLSPFASLKTVFASLVMWLLVFIVSLIWSFLFMLIPTGLLIVAIILNSEILLLTAQTIMLALSVIISLWISRYKFLWLIFTEGKSGGVFGSYRKFMQLMRRRTGEALYLRITYFSWDIVSSFIPFLSVVYDALMSAVYAKYISYFRGELSIGEEDIPPEL